MVVARDCSQSRRTVLVASSRAVEEGAIDSECHAIHEKVRVNIIESTGRV